MKYLKTHEKWYSDKLIKPNYEIGDVVEIIDGKELVIAEIKDIRYETTYPIYWVREFGGDFYDVFEAIETDIVRKLDDYEIDSIKYNL